MSCVQDHREHVRRYAKNASVGKSDDRDVKVARNTTYAVLI